MLKIDEDDLSGAGTRALLAIHLAGMQDSSPPGSVFALDLSGLQMPSVTVWTVRRGSEVLSIGALKDIGSGCGELKSMRTHPNHLRQGLGALLLEHMIGEAKRRGMRRLSLETGSGEAFEPALALYRKRGFANGNPFADYEQSDFNQFLHLELQAPP
jgi:putative acetyltransferase